MKSKPQDQQYELVRDIAELDNQEAVQEVLKEIEISIEASQAQIARFLDLRRSVKEMKIEEITVGLAYEQGKVDGLKAFKEIVDNHKQKLKTIN